MKNRLLLIVTIVFAILTFFGCNKDQADEGEANENPVVVEGIDTTEIPDVTEEQESEEVETEENAYYVSLDGDDANPGTIEEPWKTFAKAMGEVRPGQTIYIMEGVYKDQLEINRSGTDGAPITIMAYPGDTVTIDGEGLLIDNWDGLIRINNQAYIRVSGFNVINSSSMGIFADGSEYITIDNNYVYNTPGPGIHAWGDSYLIIDGNTLEYTCNLEGAPLECMSLRNTFVFEVKNNHVFDSGAIGIDSAESFGDGKIHNNEVHDTGLGIYLDGWDEYGSDVEVYDNICYSNSTGFAVNSENGGTVENIMFYNNIAYGNDQDGFNVCWGGVYGTDHIVKNLEISSNLSFNNGGSGFAILGVVQGQVDGVMLANNIIYNNAGGGITINGVTQGSLEYSIKNISVINNTIYSNGKEGVWGSGGIYISNPGTTAGTMENINIQNNIISQNENFSIAVWKHGMQPVNIDIQYNLIDGYMNDINKYGETMGDNYIIGSPQFVDAANGDFHITSESPAIDAGLLDDAPEEDFDGAARPEGEGIDIGAYELKVNISSE